MIYEGEGHDQQYSVHSVKYALNQPNAVPVDHARKDKPTELRKKCHGG